MHPQLAENLTQLRLRRNFDASSWITKKLSLFNEYMTCHGLKAAVVSVSGGVDSAVTFALTLAASRCENSSIKKVLGLAQPIHSTESIWKRALELGDALKADIKVIDQSDCFDALAAKVESTVEIPGKQFARGQLKSYMRTPTSYFTAQLLSQQGLPCVVMGTGNRDEDGYLKYFCKAGDGVVDIQLLADLHKSEVFKVGSALDVPSSILAAAPSADLWDGQTDEEELGFEYDFIELFTEWMDLPEEEQRLMKASITGEALEEWDRCAEAAKTIHKRNSHKDGIVNLNVF
eukprot:Selendium_serpulae@DN4662_c0_g1_i1.p2